MVYVEAVIKDNTIVTQSLHYIGECMVSYMEIPRNSNNFNEAFKFATLFIIYFPFDAIKYFPSVVILFCPRFYWKLLAIFVDSMFVKFTIVVLDVVSYWVF